MESEPAKNKSKKLPILMLSSGISIGTGLGISLGVVFENIPVGLSIGAGAGIAIGMALNGYYSSKNCVKK